MSGLLIRADAGDRIGTGHVMRCLALAQAWQASGGRAVFLGRFGSQALRARLEQAGITVLELDTPHPDPCDLLRTVEEARARACEWVVLDGYHFDPDFQRAVRAAGLRVLVIDDTAHWPQYSANALLSQNLYAERRAYGGDPGTMMLGTRFVLLRAEFQPWRGRVRAIPARARRVLVTLGGADPHNLTATVVEALLQIGDRDLEVTVVVGANNGRAVDLVHQVSRASLGGHGFRVLEHTSHMPELMDWADIAVSGAGSTCWELAYMGVPAILIVLADNQAEVARALDAEGYAICAGEWATVRPLQLADTAKRLIGDVTARAEMAARGRQLVDGCGAARVVQQLRHP
jgi:UDP-2,4-diacetamido-2,4,6-trideoxy-beta-L-altropyranose hydrolase